MQFSELPLFHFILQFECKFSNSNFQFLPLCSHFFDSALHALVIVGDLVSHFINWISKNLRGVGLWEFGAFLAAIITGKEVVVLQFCEELDFRVLKTSAFEYKKHTFFANVAFEPFTVDFWFAKTAWVFQLSIVSFNSRHFVKRFVFFHLGEDSTVQTHLGANWVRLTQKGKQLMTCSSCFCWWRLCWHASETDFVF